MGKFIAVIIIAMIVVFGAVEGSKHFASPVSALNTEDVADRQAARKEREEWARLEMDRYSSFTFALNIFTTILSVGVSLSLVAGTFWITYQAGNFLYNRSVVHYAKDGIKPVFMERGDGYTIVRDTNLSTEATSIIETPTFGNKARHTLKNHERQTPVDKTLPAPEPVKQLIAARAQQVQLASLSSRKPTTKQIEKAAKEDEEIINATFRPTREFTIVDTSGEKSL
jgi:hypothetical protein